MNWKTIGLIFLLVFTASSCEKKGSIKVSGNAGVSFKAGKSSLAPLFNYGNKEYKLRTAKIMKWIKWEQRALQKGSV